MQGSRQNLNQTWLFEQENDDRRRYRLRGDARQGNLKNILHVVHATFEIDAGPVLVYACNKGLIHRDVVEKKWTPS